LQDYNSNVSIDSEEQQTIDRSQYNSQITLTDVIELMSEEEVFTLTSTQKTAQFHSEL
jgi:hypothetical protein